RDRSIRKEQPRRARREALDEDELQGIRPRTRGRLEPDSLGRIERRQAVSRADPPGDFHEVELIDKASVFTDALRMTSLPVTQARSKLYQLMDEAADSHEPIQITGKRSNAVLVSEEDWRSIQETLHLLSIPGM